MIDTTTKPQSAQILYLPTASLPPIIQTRKTGRLPKVIGILWRVRNLKLSKDYRAKQKQIEIEKCRESVAIIECALHGMKCELIQAQQEAARGQS